MAGMGEFRGWLVGPHTLWVALGVCWFLLAVAVLVLMVSRWGQVRPLTKCAVLSVLAHVLLIWCAYLFRWFDYAAPPMIASGSIEAYLDLEGALEPAEAPLQETAPQPAANRPIESTIEPVAADVAEPNFEDAQPELRTAELPPSPESHSHDSVADAAITATEPGGEAQAEVPPATEPADVPDITLVEPRDLPEDPVAPLSTGLGDEVPTQTRQNRRADDQVLPAPYVNRFVPDRLQVIQQSGGDLHTESQVKAALQYLVRFQSPDGRWDAAQLEAGRESRRDGRDRRGAGLKGDTAISGLALLALMGAGNTHLQGDYHASVARGLDFLIQSQAPDGNLSGDEGYYGAMYCHGMALLAMAEAYALTGDVRLKEGVQRGVQFTVDAQHPQSGGWRYAPWRDRPDDYGDMSQFGWQVMALYSARQARLDVPSQVFDRARKFLASCSQQGNFGGLAVYQPGHPVTPAMTAEAMFIRYLLQTHHERQRREAAEYLLTRRPGTSQPDFYLWYYGTLALHQIQGPAWIAWNSALVQQLGNLQIADGPDVGSWDPDPVWGSHGGRVYSTALAALCLEVYYRYSPLIDGHRMASGG